MTDTENLPESPADGNSGQAGRAHTEDQWVAPGPKQLPDWRIQLRDSMIGPRTVALAAADPRTPHSTLSPRVCRLWAERTAALTQYGSKHVPRELRDLALSALLHAHTNRLGDLAPDSGNTWHCLHLARQTAATLLHETGTTP